MKYDYLFMTRAALPSRRNSEIDVAPSNTTDSSYAGIVEHQRFHKYIIALISLRAIFSIADDAIFKMPDAEQSYRFSHHSHRIEINYDDEHEALLTPWC